MLCPAKMSALIPLSINVLLNAVGFVLILQQRLNKALKLNESR
jgi:hypothetical protein